MKYQNRLKIKEKAEILAQENCQKWGNQLKFVKRGTLTPLPNTLLDRCLKLYTLLWNIWTYQQLGKKITQLVYNLTQIVYNFTQV